MLNNNVYLIILNNIFIDADKPGAPRNLKVTGVTQNSVSLKWNEPDSDGGSELTNYVLEDREGVRRAWQRVGSVDVTEECQYTVPLLTEGAQYVFRVAAENSVGVGEFAELSQTVIPKSQFGKWKIYRNHSLLRL